MRFVRAATNAAVAAAVAASCGRGRPGEPDRAWRQPAPPVPAAAQVWVVDDSVRVGRRDGPRPEFAGEGNPVWAPGGAVDLFALPGETIALQVGITAPAGGLASVTVDLERLDGPDGAPGLRNPVGAAPASGRPIERFVVHDLVVEPRSHGRDPAESLGWYPGARPPDRGNRGLVPDPLIPVDLAPAWCDYPMTVQPGEHRLVWIDLALADDAPAGDYRGTVRVAAAGAPLADIPVRVRVGRHRLPYAAVKTMLVYHPDAIRRRAGDAAIAQYLQLVHRHHITPVFRVNSAAEAAERAPQLSGELFTAARGYRGPGAGRGQDVIAIGTYGSLGEPGPRALAAVEAAVTALDRDGLLAGRDAFVYAVDEQCDSDRAPRWRALLDRSAVPAVRRLLVAHTCDRPPAAQPVDLAIVPSWTYDPALAATAIAGGKRVWVYNGRLPRTGSFLTDGDPLSLRANAWLQAVYGVERWFYWESVFWDDENRGGRGPYDPWTRAITFHNDDGDVANGDGVLVYPGRQPRYPDTSLGFAGVLPSIRLKQWRRGIQDAGYLALARRVDAASADRVARGLIGRGFTDAGTRGAPAWPRDGARWVEARRALFDLIEAR